MGNIEMVESVDGQTPNQAATDDEPRLAAVLELAAAPHILAMIQELPSVREKLRRVLFVAQSGHRV